MRCLMMVQGVEENAGMPTRAAFERMEAFNAEMEKAGVLLELTGLKPSSQGARVSFDETGRPTVTDGPFGETKELIGGFWIIEVQSLAEAVEWARRVPQGEGLPRRIEVRPYFEAEDFAYLQQQGSSAGTPNGIAEAQFDRLTASVKV